VSHNGHVARSAVVQVIGLDQGVCVLIRPGVTHIRN